MSRTVDAPVHLTEAQLGDLVDGTALAPGESESAEPHLEQCERCRRELALARDILAASRGSGSGVTAPPELWPLVAAQTIHRAELRRRVFRSLRPMLLVAALMLVGVTAAVTTWIVHRFPGDAPATPADVRPLSPGPAPEPPRAPRAPRAPRRVPPGPVM